MAIRDDARPIYEDLFTRYPAKGKIMILGRPTLKWDGAPSPEDYFRSFGFDEVHSLDVSTYQGATHVQDLNAPLAPSLAGQYDFVHSGGTLEHVFDVANALKSAAALVKTGGVAIVGGPTNNWVDHGFYQLSPTLFFDYFSDNDWELGMSTMQYRYSGDRSRLVFPMYPGEGNLTIPADARASMLVTALRLPHSTVDRIPLQGMYLDKHNGERRKFRFRAIAPWRIEDGQVSPSDLVRVTIEPKTIKEMDGHYAASFRDAACPPSLPQRPFRSKALLFEDDKLMDWIVSEPAMVAERPRSFCHFGGFIHFSTDSDARGKHYEIAYPAPEPATAMAGGYPDDTRVETKSATPRWARLFGLHNARAP